MNLINDSIQDIRNINKEVLVSLIHNFNRSKIKSVFIWTMKEYQQTVSLYSIDKANCINEIDAFVCLWLASKIDYENWWSLNKTIEEREAEILYEHNLKQYIDSIELSIKEPNFLSQYSKSQIDEKIRFVKDFRARYPIEDDDLDKAEQIQNGIYLNYKFANEKEFNFKVIDVTKGYQLYHEKSYAGYRDLFFESENEYFYFTE